MIGMNWDYPEADYDRRAEIWKAHEDYTKGLFYFLGHDERVPEFMRTEILKWGYPKDEYVDNNHWTHQLYVREARRMIGDLVMTEHHCVGKEVVDDVIGWAAYTMDSHNCDRIVVRGEVKNEGNVEIGGFIQFLIGLSPRNAEKLLIYLSRYAFRLRILRMVLSAWSLFLWCWLSRRLWLPACR